MRLTKQAIECINTPDIRRELSDKDVLDCTDQTIIRYIHRNENNGPLTTVGAVRVIKELTGLGDDEILEEKDVVEVNAVQK